MKLTTLIPHRARLASTLAALAVAALAAGAARAQTEEPDDPKLARRLGPRAASPQSGASAPASPQSGASVPASPQSGASVPASPQSGASVPASPQSGASVPASPPPGARARAPVAGPASAAVAPLGSAATGPSAGTAPASPGNDGASAWWTQAVRGGDASSATTSVYSASSPPEPAPAAPRPRLKLAYRRFDFVRVGASGSATGTVAGEPFDSLSLDVYPLSSLVRIGLSSQYGWQSGAGLSGGDYFAAESASVGAQLRGGRVIPFGEAFAGIGYMRRLQFERTIPTAYWQLGIDAGAEIFVARTGFVSVAIGYLRPVNGFAMQQKFGSVFVDTWSFKLGVGL